MQGRVVGKEEDSSLGFGGEGREGLWAREGTLEFP